MKALMFTVAFMAAGSALFAQEAGAMAEEQGGLAAAAEEANADGGQAVADQATAKGAELAAEAPSQDFVSAEDQVNADLEKLNLSIGYDSAKKAIIQIGTFSMKIENPAKDPGFCVKREQAANVAYLNAKAEVIKAINADFSAVDRACTYVDETVDENADKVAAVKNAVEEKRAELAETLRQYSEADAKAVTDVTLNDRYNAFLDAVIKKIDTDYSPDAIAAKKKIGAEEAKSAADAIKAKVKALEVEYKALEAAAEKLPKDIATDSSSAAKLMAKMPLMGSSVLTQAESWDQDTKIYSVSMAIVWSPKLQASAVKMGTGDFSSSGKPGKFSRAEWARAQDWRVMVGSRRFTDDKGRNIFVGIASADLTGPVAKQAGKKKLADTLATKNVAMSLIGDIETYREASQNMKVYSDDSAAVSQKLSDNISAKVDINLKGCMPLMRKTFKHPISGHSTYVVAYYIDPELAAGAGDILKKSYADAVGVSKHTQRERGRHQGMQDVLKKVRDSKDEFGKGCEEGNGVVKKPDAGKGVHAKPDAPAGSGQVPGGSGKPNGGTYSGGTIDTDY